MTKIVMIGTAITLISTLFFANVWQSYRFVQLEREVVATQRRHQSLLEENKRLVVGIASLRSPRRIRALAETTLALEPLSSDRIQRVDLSGGARGTP
ncbi:hypothetical protein AU468_02705 [Alkalispirochaeta sphaeroplastigenens]|uniref:Cell division protein FtsL n=1 Tax=Alkalispirochaeta sphaeroplastigenens TaxID=1187066 RepID=A0A2S4JZ10_9SPIO|nr:hypothetical protein [Alkalispirochaeta sphaeroplastigenens]POR04741.1 hypothetical protein AU468_02705 [Alkalispirochaeta sphaeroplastigenens]